MRRFGRLLAWLTLVAGSLLITEAALTVAWKEPFSALYTKREQASLSRELAQVERAYAGPPVAAEHLQQDAVLITRRERIRRERARLAAVARAVRRRADAGQPLGRIRIPRIGIRFVVVAGTGEAELRGGPGHYERTGLPGERRTVGIAGHRTTYLAPFRDLDKLRRGNSVLLEMPYATFLYRVTQTKIVSPDAGELLADVGHERVVLTACHPLFSEAQRIVVFGRLASVAPPRSSST